MSFLSVRRGLPALAEISQDTYLVGIFKAENAGKHQRHLVIKAQLAKLQRINSNKTQGVEGQDRSDTSRQVILSVFPVFLSFCFGELVESGYHICTWGIWGSLSFTVEQRHAAARRWGFGHRQISSTSPTAGCLSFPPRFPRYVGIFEATVHGAPHMLCREVEPHSPARNV